MKNLLTLLFLFSIALASGQSIKDLDFLIGEWEVEETIMPGTDKEYKETGKRRCSYFLNDSCILMEAETTISTSGRKRTYMYIINYDIKENCYWATAVASDFPKQGLHKWFLDKENKIIKAITPKNVIEDRFFRATIDYSNPDQLVWNGWASIFKNDKEWFQIFNDVATRKK
ncbi:MAG: hypothetical protein RLO81_19995 [Fulvivirga sp.]|uniref:hypothetical protein n=1 Tax=Fulvivirga sp. TaxID=1931237 RepID=UPI0032EB908B